MTKQIQQSDVSGSVDFRVGDSKKFTMVFLELRGENLYVLTFDRTKELFIISMKKAIFRKKVSLTKNLPEDISPTNNYLFEISSDRVYQIRCFDNYEYSKWMNVLPCMAECMNVFGMPLDVGIKKSGWRFPLPLYRCFEYLEQKDAFKTPGLFRVSGQQAEVRRIKSLFDTGEDVDLDNAQIDCIETITGVIKLYLLELPDSLIPSKYYNDFLTIAINYLNQMTENEQETVGNEEEKKQGEEEINIFTIIRIKDIVNKFSKNTKNTLWFLFKYFVKIVENSDVNQMNTNNLGICLTPSLFRNNDIFAGNQMIDVIHLNYCFGLLMKYFNDIFEDIENEKWALNHLCILQYFLSIH